MGVFYLYAVFGGKGMKSKKRAANIALIAAVAVMLLASVFAAGSIMGWFDKADDDTAMLTGISGIIDMERSGTAFFLEEDTPLRTGDKLTLKDKSAAKIALNGIEYIMLDEGTALEVSEAKRDGFAAKLSSGRAFINVKNPVTITLGEREFTLKDTAAIISNDVKSSSISVFSGSVGEAAAGQTLTFFEKESRTENIDADKLDDFSIEQLEEANVDWRSLLINEEKKEEKEAEQAPSLAPQASDAPKEEDEQEQEAQASAKPSASAKLQDKEDAPKPKPTDTKTEKKEYAGYVTLSIRCDTILNNMDKLTPSKTGYVPKSGVILKSTKVGFYSAESVFDVLKRTCQSKGIQLEYSYTPLYGSYYIEGINHIYEFDCGNESGWMYKVNGSLPGYGCSQYELNGGENIAFCYTCTSGDTSGVE